MKLRSGSNTGPASSSSSSSLSIASSSKNRVKKPVNASKKSENQSTSVNIDEMDVPIFKIVSSIRTTKKKGRKNTNSKTTTVVDEETSNPAIQKMKKNLDKDNKSYENFKIFEKKLAAFENFKFQPLNQEIFADVSSEIDSNHNKNDNCSNHNINSSETIDYDRYLFHQLHSDRIAKCLNDLDLKLSSKNFSFENIKRNRSYNNDDNDPFGIIELIQNEMNSCNNSLIENIHNYLNKFNQLLELFIEQSQIDHVYVNVNNMHAFINDHNILKRYLMLFLNELFDKNIDDDTNLALIPFIYVLFVQKIAIHNLNCSTSIDLLSNELIDDNSISDHFMLPLLQSKSNTIMDQSKTLAILIIGINELFNILDNNNNDNNNNNIEKFAQILEIILKCQYKCMDLRDQQQEQQQNRFDNIPQQPSTIDVDDDDDIIVDEEKLIELLLCQLYCLLSIKTSYRLILKYNNNIDYNIDNHTCLLSIDRLFSKLFRNIFDYDLNNDIIKNFYHFIYRLHSNNECSILNRFIDKYGNEKMAKFYKIVTTIDTLSQLMYLLPNTRFKSNDDDSYNNHLHLFWLLFTLIKINNAENDKKKILASFENKDMKRIRNNYNEAIKPMIDIVWCELPKGSMKYLANFILTYTQNFGIDKFSIDLSKSMIQIPNMDREFQMVLHPLISIEYAKC